MTRPLVLIGQRKTGSRPIQGKTFLLPGGAFSEQSENKVDFLRLKALEIR
jgi:hypothetical protein